MSRLISGNNAYNICTEGEVSNIISHFDPDYIFDVIKDNINNRLHFFQLNMVNIPGAYELYYKQLLNKYSDSTGALQEIRDDTYKQIIDILCSASNLTIDYSDIQDYYSLSFHLYDFIVSEFVNNIVKFFVNYIFKEKNSLYDSLNLSNLKKNKDSSTLYTKRLYKNPKLAIINANLDYVINNICTFDISFELLINTIYQDKNLAKFLLNTISPIGDFFKESYVSLLHSEYRNIILTSIKMQLHSLCCDTTDINITGEGEI